MSNEAALMLFLGETTVGLFLIYLGFSYILKKQEKQQATGA